MFTLRQPPPPYTSSNNALASTELQGSFTQVHSQTFAALNQPTFNEFSANIESIHNLIHLRIGGRGHMGNLITAPYDPIFWILHANVDRLTAMFIPKKFSFQNLLHTHSRVMFQALMGSKTAWIQTSTPSGNPVAFGLKAMI